ncbi:MAG: SAM-dependent methyltransferase [Pseudomonadales bacterium]|jgi:SAM-dependent methyltransferase
MRESIRSFMEICTDTMSLEGPVYEFGAMQVEGNADIADLRPLFPESEFYGCDMREGQGVDIVLDLHQIDLPSGAAQTVIALDTLEHVERPWEAMAEIKRVLKPGGIAILTSVMRFPIHGYPNDYWRFTPEGLRSLFKIFDHSFIGSCGGAKDFPQTEVGIGFNGDKPDLNAFDAKYSEWAHWNNKIDEKLLPLEILEF